MLCPKCGGKTMVIDSRMYQDERGVRRRRYCPKCEERFTTHEMTDDMAMRHVIPSMQAAIIGAIGSVLGYKNKD